MPGLKVGDIVKIKKSSKHYNTSFRNPTCNGVLEKNDLMEGVVLFESEVEER